MFIVIQHSQLRLQSTSGKFVCVKRFVSLDTALADLRTKYSACKNEGNTRNMAAIVEVAEYIKSHPALLMAIDADDDFGNPQLICTDTNTGLLYTH